jgi:hypothetical protein
MAQAASAIRQAPAAMIEMRLSIIVISFLRSAVGDSRTFPGALTSTVWRGEQCRHARNVPHSVCSLLVETIGEGEPPAALAPEVSGTRAPHRKRLAEHRSLAAILAHEDNPPGRTGHVPTPSLAVVAGR